MKKVFVAMALSVAALGVAMAPADVEAKRLGGGRPAGMQRQMPSQPAGVTPHTPAQAPTQAAAPAAARPATPMAAPAPARRSWMAPLAGLAAGLGLAALASHFGFGEAMGNIMTMLLLGVAAMFLVRFVMSRMARSRDAALAARGPQWAGAAAGAGVGNAAPVGGWQTQAAPLPAPTMERSALAPAAGAAAFGAAPATLPGGIAHDEFIRLAKMVFIRMQAANDAANVEDLRKFTTPELFASLRLDLQERGNVKQQTDVVRLDAQVADVVRENGMDIVSVRYHGLIRETADGAADPFDELWHLVRAADGQGDWAIAGITPQQA